MKFPFLIFAVTLAFSAVSAFAAENTSFEAEFKALGQKVQAKIGNGTRSEFRFATELKEFDALAAKYSSNPEQAAKALFMKGMLYVQVLDEPGKALEVFQVIKKKYPETEIGTKVTKIIAAVELQQKAEEANAALIPGKQFPPFEVTDTDGNTLSIASRKAKVILIDFWATWCGPCIVEFPGLVALYKKYHDQGFDIIGISLDYNKTAMASFIRRNNIPWPQHFGGGPMENKLALQYGISKIPATFLVDSKGKILARDVTAEDLSEILPKLLGGN